MGPCFLKQLYEDSFEGLCIARAVDDDSLTFSIANLSPAYSSHAWYSIVPYSLPIAQTTMTSSVYLTVSLTVERYISVVKPFFRLKNKFSQSSVNLATPGLLFAVLFR